MANVRITGTPNNSPRKVKVTGVPNQMASDYDPAAGLSEPATEVARALKKVPRDEANIEAEDGETVYFPDQGGLPAHYNINGNRHHSGGVPLNVPKDSFVFSDTKKMKIKDPDLLAFFGKSKGSFTPADLAKKYNINKYRKILQDPDSDSLDVKTAEKMIANYELKLGKLALIQESKKGFPQGIPVIAMPYLATYSIQPDSILPLKDEEGEVQEGEEEEGQMMQYGGDLPEAQFGFQYPGRRQGRGRGRRLDNYYPQYPPIEYTQNTSRNYPVGSSTKTTKKVMSKTPPKGAIVIDYDPASTTAEEVLYENKERIGELKTPVYLKRADGKYEKVVPRSETITTRDTDLSEKAGTTYEYLRRTLKGENAKPAIAKMYEKYKEHINNSKNLSDDRKKALLAKTPTEVVDNFLRAQKQVYKINDAKKDLSGEIDQWNTTKQGRNKKYKDTVKELKLKELSPDEIAEFQASYRGFADIQNDPEAKSIRDFDLTPVGAQRDKRHTYKLGEKESAISDVDDLFGAATAGQAMRPKTGYGVSPFEGEEIDEDQVVTEQGAYTSGKKPTPFWIQDVINTGAALGNRLGVKKYLPWAPTVEPNVPRATYYDPTRELAANAEQMQIGTQGAAGFAGPQAYNARFSQIQGAGAKNAANILGRYHNQNVGVANKFSSLKSDIYNKANQMNAALATDLYNKTTVANQQFDNAKRKANTELTGAYVNAITNRSQAQTMNMMYPHFQINPMIGGDFDFYKGDEIIPGSGLSDAESRLKQISKWKTDYPGLDEETYREAAGFNKKKQRGSQEEDMAAMQSIFGNS